VDETTKQQTEALLFSSPGVYACGKEGVIIVPFFVEAPSGAGMA
jgi:hypothetical protein